MVEQRAQALKTASLVNNERNPKPKEYENSNPEADKLLKQLQVKEYELSKILAKIPKGTKDFEI